MASIFSHASYGRGLWPIGRRDDHIGPNKIVTASANQRLDLLLEMICMRVQLTATQHDSAEDHYEAVSKWLSKEGSLIRLYWPIIYPQGSLSLGTTVKPLRRAEFDLDLVCLLTVNGDRHPGEVYRLIWDRMAANRRYAGMMEQLPRCIRLNYAGDFHLDIVPAVPDDEAGNTCILVPDLKANLQLQSPENDRWKPSNPKGCREWLEGRCVHYESTMFAQASAEPLPEREAVHDKPALKRSIQLFKRWRDKEFQHRPKLAPPSIILTTLSGHLYRGEIWCTDALRTILNGIVAAIESGQPICLTNPAHPKEDICEKWRENPDSYKAFKTAVRRFRNRWERLLQLQGIDEIAAELGDLFEDESSQPVRKAVEEYTRRRVTEPRSGKRLLMERSTGMLGAAPMASGIVVRPNRFFGDEKRSS